MRPARVTNGPERCPSASTTTGGSPQIHSPLSSSLNPQFACMSSRSIAFRPRTSCSHIAPLQSSMAPKSEKTIADSVRSFVNSAPGGMGFIWLSETVLKRTF